MSDAAPLALPPDLAVLLDVLARLSPALATADTRMQLQEAVTDALHSGLGATSASILLESDLSASGPPPGPLTLTAALRMRRSVGTLAVTFSAPRVLSGSETTFLDSLIAQLCAALERLDLGHQHTEQAGERAHLSGQNEALDAFTHFTELSATTQDVPALALRAAQVLRATLGEVSVAYYEREDALWKARAWSDDISPEVVSAIQAGVPLDAPSFAGASALEEPLFVSGWNAQAEFIEETREYGAVAFYPYRLADTPYALLVIGTQAAHEWTARERTIFRAVGRSLGLALERASQTRILAERTEALDAFVRFAEGSGLSSDLGELVEQAFGVLETFFPGCTCSFHECQTEAQETRWETQYYTHNITVELAEIVLAGLPLDTPLFAAALASGEADFVDDWFAQVPGSDEPFRTTGVYPISIGGAAQAFLSIWLKISGTWQARDRAIVRAVGRSLNLALERAAVTEELRRQRAELLARTQALEAFAVLTRDLTLQAEEVTLVHRAQEVALSLLPEGCALYYRPEGQLWRLGSQIGSLNAPALQAAIDAGLPYETTHNLLLPWQTRQPYYQSQYDRDTDNLQELTGKVGATAALPVMVAGQPVGIFVVALFGQRTWTAADRSSLEAVVGSLSLANEGAQSVLALRARSAELERSNSELEQFAYVASHDLQEPLRTVTSFAQLLVGKYRGQLDPKADVYLGMISDGTARMSRLLQDLLTFSRVATSAQPMRAVPTGEVVEAVLSDLQDQLTRSGASITVDPLPSVWGDTTQLRQLFQNLIGNALKFSTPDRPPEVHLSAERDGPHWRFSLQDNGIGIAPAFFERIFTIFQRLHSREEYEGSGIGLAITRKIVERHGGQIWLESQPGEGTTFFFTLPDAPQEAR
ncbi:hypothetical protein GCM10022631_23620 [Deinococcus rubellus]|uniref:sensor histidine kinase n=1 Tax=Deinococcus rubellus TaxID=1889240 RepID=UPI0031F11118